MCVSREVVTLLAGFSLAWFIVGILAGRVIFGKKAPKKQRQRSPRGAGKQGRVELYVGNLSYDVSNDDLLNAFKPFGKVLSARVIEHKFNGKSKGYGFVEMADLGEARAAVRALNGKDVSGRRIVVNEAKSRSRRGQ